MELTDEEVLIILEIIETYLYEDHVRCTEIKTINLKNKLTTWLQNKNSKSFQEEA